MTDYTRNPLLGHPSVETYIVCCTDLHASIGPFVSLTDAVDYAEELNTNVTNIQKCVFFPVPFTFRGEIIVYRPGPDGEGQDWRRGGYL